MRASLIMALAFVNGVAATGPLADIGPAPRTVLVDSAGKPFDLAVLREARSCSCRSSTRPATASVRRRRRPSSGFRRRLEQAKLWGTSVEFVSITLDPKARHARGPGPLCPASSAPTWPPGIF